MHSDVGADTSTIKDRHGQGDPITDGDDGRRTGPLRKSLFPTTPVQLNSRIDISLCNAQTSSCSLYRGGLTLHVGTTLQQVHRNERRHIHRRRSGTSSKRDVCGEIIGTQQQRQLSLLHFAQSLHLLQFCLFLRELPTQASRIHFSRLPSMESTLRYHYLPRQNVERTRGGSLSLQRNTDIEIRGGDLRSNRNSRGLPSEHRCIRIQLGRRRPQGFLPEIVEFPVRTEPRMSQISLRKRAGFAAAAHTSRQADLRKSFSVGASQERASLHHASRRDPQILIGTQRSLHQAVEFGVFERPPPRIVIRQAESHVCGALLL